VLAKSVSAAKGLPSLPLVIVPHPIGGLTPKEVQDKADGAIEQVLRLLTKPREELAASWNQRQND
jgi:hypothetical protein